MPTCFKILSFVILSLCIFTMKNATCSEEYRISPEAAPAKKAIAKVTQVTGEVAAVDAAGKTITVVKKVKGKEIETVVTVDDKTLAEVKAGDKVSVKYTTADGKNTAKSVKMTTRTIEPRREFKTEMPLKAPPELSINSISLIEPSGNGTLDAEEKGKIIVSLTNSGKGPGINVKLVVDILGSNQSITQLHFDKEIKIGQIDPGEQKSFNINITASEYISTDSINLKVTAVESNGFDSQPVILSFKTKELIPPLLQLTNVSIQDADGKRVISKGKESYITLTIQNAGTGTARDVTANIELESSDVKLFSNNKVVLGSLLPGESKKVSFNIAVTQRYSGSKILPVLFLIREERGRFSIKPDIKLALNEEAPDIKVVRVEAKELPQVRLESAESVEDINIIPSISPSTKGFGENDIALVIGIENYQNLPKSAFSYNDSKLVKAYLKALGFVERNIELVTDEKATLSGIKKSLESWISNRAKKNSKVFIYYSGHGSPDPVTGEVYIVPHDGDPNYLSDTGYPLKSLYNSLAKLTVAEITVILDTCFSGAGGRSVLAKGARPAIVKIEDPVILSQNIVVLSSTEGAQISTSIAEKEHGVFTYYFLKAIKDGKKNISEIYNYIKPMVEDEAKKQNVSQSPSISPTPDKLVGRFNLRK